MANFTQLHLGNKTPQENSSKPAKNNPLSRQKTLFGAGLLAVTALSGVFLLITNGCSKGPAKVPASSANVNPAPVTAAVNPPVAPPNVPAEAPKPAHRRVQRKAPTATYADPLHGISFRYPKTYILKTGDDPSFDMAGMGVQTDFVQPGGMTVAAIEMPGNSYPGTDFASALFGVSVNSQLNASQCEQFAFSPSSPSEKEPALPAKVKVGNSDFTIIETLGGAEKSSRTKYYHRFENGNCYEFALGLATADSPVDGVQPVNRDLVFRKLEQILASVKLQPAAAPEVAKGTQDHPVVEGGKE